MTEKNLNAFTDESIQHLEYKIHSRSKGEERK